MQQKRNDYFCAGLLFAVSSALSRYSRIYTKGVCMAVERHLKISIPADVPLHAESDFYDNYQLLTKETDNIFLFSVDHKIEHLARDFYGPSLASEILNPEHIFAIANEGYVGALATHPGLIARYGAQYEKCRYVVKMNAKTTLLDRHQDPMGAPLIDVEQLVALKEESKLPIIGVAVSIYLGSSYEREMFSYASQTIYRAHQYGLITFLWMYTRGIGAKGVHEGDAAIDSAGVAVSLGADFVKISAPHTTQGSIDTEQLARASVAAGNSKVMCAGGDMVTPEKLFNTIHVQLNEGKTNGIAIGRNIFQRPFNEAVALTRALFSLIYEAASPSRALALYHESYKGLH